MVNIKELLIRQIKEYDLRAYECCAAIVLARLENQPEGDQGARMVACITSREALRYFGEQCGLLEKDDGSINQVS